jgi:hypothetical protein
MNKPLECTERLNNHHHCNNHTHPPPKTTTSAPFLQSKTTKEKKREPIEKPDLERDEREGERKETTVDPPLEQPRTPIPQPNFTQE